ncbi:hypothetical protein NLU13_7093 [Sarocladium strictum]|uniref:Uncharacterized protein n=1 Tax=Sarocladium strictum TaxID=5046 RepID=A0AA39GFW5_SARSR|nr:hypothetical protein NLU13_7093 [Sarocladium strictum]
MADTVVAVASASTGAGPHHHRPSSSSPPPSAAAAAAAALSSPKLDSFRSDQQHPASSSRVDDIPSTASASPPAASLSEDKSAVADTSPTKLKPSTRETSPPSAEMTVAPVLSPAQTPAAATPTVAADNSKAAHAPSPSSLDSRRASHSERGPPSISTAVDNDSVATQKTTPSPTTGRKADLSLSRKPLPSASPDSEDWPPSANGHSEHLDEADRQSELEKGRNVETTLPSAGVDEPLSTHDEIVVNAGASTGSASPSRASPAELEDEDMPDAEDDEPIVSHYPKRKRTSMFQDLSEDKLENTKAGRDDSPLTPSIIEADSKPVRQTVGNAKGVILGYWRESPVPNESNKHAVIGFIDIRDRLRTRIQSVDRDGGRISSEYALAPGPGNCWVTFDKVAYSSHLVGLDSYAIKEYVRVRAGQVESTDDERIENEQTAVDIAWEKTKAFYQIEDRADLPVKASQIAHGSVVPASHLATPRTEPKRRKISGFFNAVNADTSSDVAGDSPATAHNAALALDPLKGTRPTSILIGHWKNSMVHGKPCSPEESHAVLGILGMNDMFRVKLLRQTKSGQFFEGNFPVGAGALWIPYEDVQLEDHISDLNRNEVKEYCRVRQSQIDKGESTDEVEGNQQLAAREAKNRAAILYSHKPLPPGAVPRGISELIESPASTPTELRQSSRAGLRRESRSSRYELEVTHTPRRSVQGEEAMQRANALAEHELAKAEAAQSRTNRYALNRERAAAAAAEETAHAAAAAVAATAAASGMPAPPPPTAQQMQAAAGRPRFSMSESAQRLNNVWASQEASRVRATGDDNVRMYDGVKFERKEMGPFIGKLTSPGTLIQIDGEDFVEYRVLTRPSFY